jgi:hypothetical protein
MHNRIFSNISIPAEDLREVALNKGLARLGDALTNFIYSLAKSTLLKESTGKHVDGQVLSQALRNSGIRFLLPKRLTAHQREDATEAILAYLWLVGYTNIEQLVSFLASQLKVGDFKSKAAEKRGATAAFTYLLNQFKGHPIFQKV